MRELKIFGLIYVGTKFKLVSWSTYCLAGKHAVAVF